MTQGDEIYYVVWTSDSSGNLGTSGAYASFYMQDGSASPPWTVHKYGVAKTWFSGNYIGESAEWIIERKGGSGSNYGPLTDFGCSAGMYGEALGVTSGSWTWRNFGTDALEYDIMYNNAENQAILSPSTGLDYNGTYDETNFCFLHPGP